MDVHKSLCKVKREGWAPFMALEKGGLTCERCPFVTYRGDEMADHLRECGGSAVVSTTMVETTRASGRESIDKILGIRRRDLVEPCFASIKKKYPMNGWENMDYEKNRLAADRVVVDIVDIADDDAIGMRNFCLSRRRPLPKEEW